MGKQLENLDDHGCLKVQDLVDGECGFVLVTQSGTRPHFTVQSASQSSLVSG